MIEMFFIFVPENKKIRIKKKPCVNFKLLLKLRSFRVFQEWMTLKFFMNPRLTSFENKGGKKQEKSLTDL